MHICSFEKCSGCAACFNACSTKAITMQVDNNGFYRPHIDADICVNCGLCKKVCPQNQFLFSNTATPACYAVLADDSTRTGSSSGGFFPILAKHILSQGGAVCGAAFDENMVLQHIIINEERYLYRLCGSKYLQSQIGNTFSEIRALLNEGKTVLFTGTPCQVAGLNNFLRKQYDNLITVDLICHGTPSQKVFDTYLSSEFPGKKVTGVNFRDKKEGWKSGRIIMTTHTEGASRSLPDSEDPYLIAFFDNISLRESCYDCSFTRMPRPGDFTMADFWGAPKEVNDGKGTSCIFTNSVKATQLFEKIRGKFYLVREYPVQLAIKAQPQLKYSVASHPARAEFFRQLDSGSIRHALEMSLFHKKNIGLLNFHWENVNFGALLTSYALNKYLTNAGYYVRNIDYRPSFDWIENEPENAAFDTFRKKHIPVTPRYSSESNLSELNAGISTFIVGSDQVWRPAFIKNDKAAFFFTFARSDKKRIAYAASFGTCNLGLSKDELDEYRAMLAVFDSISIREQSGVSICKEMGVEATQVLDPVFLLPREHWEQLANQSTRKCEDDAIIYYTIDEGIEANILESIKSTKELAGHDNVINITYNLSIEDWLFYIKNSKFFITDSFHGSCFAILFNKPFICVNPNHSTQTRMESLFSSLGIKDRLYSNFNDVPFHELLHSAIDYGTSNKLLETLRRASEKVLIDAIEDDSTTVQERAIRIEALHRLQVEQARKKQLPTKWNYFRYKLQAKLKYGEKKEKYQKKAKAAKRELKRIKNLLQGSK